MAAVYTHTVLSPLHKAFLGGADLVNKTVFKYIAIAIAAA